MTRRQRHRLFLIVAFCFLLTAPIVTLWSQGYRFDWQNKALTQVGGLYIKALPRDANLTIQNIGTRTIAPPLLADGYLWKNILPGTHEIKISKAGYIPWHKSAAIYPLQVTRFTSVLLFPETPIVEPLNKIQASDFWQSGASADAIYFSDLTGRQLFMLAKNHPGAEPQPIIGAGTDLKALRSRILEVKASPDDSTLLILLANETLLLRRAESELISLLPHLRRFSPEIENFTAVFWNPQAPAQLVATIQDRIYLIDIVDVAYRRILADDTVLGTNQEKSILLGSSGKIYRFTNRDEINPVYAFDRIILQPPQDKIAFRIEAVAGERYLLLDRKNNALWQAESGNAPKLIAKNVLDFWVSPDRSRIAMLSKDQILSVYFPTDQSADVTYPAGTILKLGLLAKAPADVFWLKNNWHLILRFPEKLEVIEIDSRFPIYRVSYPRSSVRAIWNHADNTLFYLSQNSFWTWRLP